MEIEKDNIYNIDCIEGMKMIPDNSIDCIICDLPYEVLHKANPHAQWDRIIPIEPLWEQYLRITKDNAPIILFAQGMFTSQLVMSQPKYWRYNLVWDKQSTTGFLNASRCPLRQHEDIVVFYKKQCVYNPQMIPSEPHNARAKKKYEKEKADSEYRHNRVFNAYEEFGTRVTCEKYPTSILSFPTEPKARRLHPTQKPIELLRWLVRSYSNEGDTILDNCMGSGTTAIACIKEHRHFIGFELNKEYYDKALQRINRERQQLTLF